MSTCAKWRSIGYFPSCAERKTAAEIAAIGQYVSGSLAEIMAYIWLLETVDISAGAQTKTSLQYGQTDGIVQPYPVITPNERLCGVGGNGGVVTSISDPFLIGSEDAVGRLAFDDTNVYYNTTDSNYALIPLLAIWLPEGTGQAWANRKLFSTWVANGGSCSVFGTTMNSWRDPDFADLSFSAQSPAYYTPT